MAPTPSLKVVKRTAYKGGTKEWSNRYHFNGGTPANAAAWLSFFNAVVNDEKQALPPETHIVGGVGYNAGSEVPVWSTSVDIAGTAAVFGSSPLAPLEVCALIRYTTTARTSKNHPIYLFNYVHGVYLDAGSDRELLQVQQKGDFESLADTWIAGYSDGANVYVRAGPNGATAVSRVVNAHVTHRDFPT